jgi:hypothetical protein
MHGGNKRPYTMQRMLIKGQHKVTFQLERERGISKRKKK